MTDIVQREDGVLPVGMLGPEAQRLVEQVRISRRPFFITQDGVCAAVLVEAGEYEQLQRRLTLQQLILEGKQDAAAGRINTQEEVEAMVTTPPAKAGGF